MEVRPDEEARLVRDTLERSIEAVAAARAVEPAITAIAHAIAEALRAGNKVLVCGNGGSAADAQHFAAELAGRFLSTDRPALPGIALSADGAVLTCIGNDFSYDEVFARQVRALARQGDVVVGISTSGESRSVVEALAAAPRGAVRVAIGGRGGSLAHLADLVVAVPADGTAPLQVAHAAVIHAICAVIEAHFSPAAD